MHLRKDVYPGHLTLLDPRPGFNMCSIEGDPYHKQSLMVEPQPGLFLMWPAFVGFYHHPNLSRSAQHYICFDVVPTEHETADAKLATLWNGDVHDMWSTALIKRRLPGYEKQNAELIDIIDSLERDNPDLTTDFNSERFRSYQHPAMDWLMSNINQSVTAYFKQIGIKQDIPGKSAHGRISTASAIITAPTIIPGHISAALTICKFRIRKPTRTAMTIPRQLVFHTTIRVRG